MIKRVLNAYAGIGGNRALWPDDLEIVAVEYEPAIAKFYQQRFPNDIVIITDAHQYILEHHREFDFIWSSIPCYSHSRIRRTGVHDGRYKAIYPDMKLYEEIILLQNFAPLNTKWVVENVKPYYEPLIPGKKIGRHLIWSNFLIPFAEIEDDRIAHNEINANSEIYGIKLPTHIKDGKKVLRNMVNPKLGLYIFNTAAGIKSIKTDQLTLFPEKN